MATRSNGRPAAGLVHHATLQPPRPDQVLVTVSVGPDGALYALWSPSPDRPTARAVVTAHDPAARTVAEIEDLRLVRPSVQPLPGGEVLLVAPRATWGPEGAERNAVVVDADGTPVRGATLGDGIAHLQTTLAGDVWVGYFDEGVYGNLGRGGPGPAPIGGPGIVRFGPDLVERWDFPSRSDLPWGAVSDCYALNIAGDVAWASYYTGFPVVRIDAGEVTHWRNPVPGPAALAVSGDRILLAGGYPPQRDRLVTGRLSAGGLEVTGEGRLTLPGGGELLPRPRIMGRGAELTVIIGPDCYRLAAT